MAEQTRVVHDADRSRYELFVGEELVGVATYHPLGDAVAIDHTIIEQSHRNRGLGAVLVGGTLDDLRARGARVIPQCSFVGAYIRTHPEYADLLERRSA